MSRRQTSHWESIGSTADPDVLYYNATIVNNNTDDQLNGYAFQDPLIKFNETRDTALVRDASQYQFSIIRCVVNGGNLDLPLFIPSIQSGTGQTDVDLTEYGVGVSITFSYPDTTGGLTSVYALAPPISYVEYIPEIQNPVLAPTPNAPCAPTYRGLYNALTAYSKGDIVSTLLGGSPPFYVANFAGIPVGTDPTTQQYDPITGAQYWLQTGTELGRPQDVSTRYYWVQTFQHWVDLVNTAIDTANENAYNAFNLLWTTNPGNTPANNPFTLAPATTPVYANWVKVFPSPIMSWSSSTGLFSITYPALYSQPGPAAIANFSNIYAGLWFNQNMAGLFANFNATYFNTASGDNNPPNTLVYPSGYAVKMVVEPLNFGANYLKNSAIYPVPVSPAYTGDWLIMTQEATSTSTLWSPVDSIVFVTGLLPIQNEQTAPPNTYGVGNIGNSTATAPSAFLPILTDIANDLALDPFAYRKMIYYAPTAEYRMADFQNSKAEIRTIDVQLFWRNRLNNELYPMSMYNLSSVSIKMMFRKKNSLISGLAKSERTTLY